MTNLCQELFDLKAFKGKGAAESILEKLSIQIRAVWMEMESLAKETADINNAIIYIQVHRQAGSKAIMEIRWRGRKRAGDNHLRWEYAKPAINRLSIGMQRYYEQANERLNDLNCLNSILRSTATRLLVRVNESDDGRCAGKLWTKWISEKKQQQILITQ